jgi:hypothetical protein
MSFIEIALGLSILAVCVAWYVWVNRSLRSKETQLGFSGNATAPRDILLGADSKIRHTISKDYQIKYARQVYIGIPFELDIVFADPGQLKIEPTLVVRGGHVQFETVEEEPIVKVEIAFATGSFEANETLQQKPLQKQGQTIFSFWLKPLKSENCLLTITISSATQEQIEEKVTQIHVSTVQDASGQKVTTTVIKKPPTTEKIYRQLDRVTLNVSVVSFMGFNARELSFLGKYLGAIISLLLVAISYFTGRNFDLPQAVGYLILGVVTPFGISVYDGVKGILAPPTPEKSK